MIFEFIIIFILLFIILGLVYQFMYDIYMGVFIVCTTFYFCYVVVKVVFYMRRKKKTRETQIAPITKTNSVKTEIKETPKIEKKEDKNLETLKVFIQKNVKQGFQTSVIKEALTKQGWPKELVEQALKESK
ncbi:hypothetical protein EXS74_01175 [Candidatus Woesearchaeota archaeon]|nr:hypothetical protein [Candidatus Woesearchaeota archaeon]